MLDRSSGKQTNDIVQTLLKYNLSRILLEIICNQHLDTNGVHDLLNLLVYLLAYGTEEFQSAIFNYFTKNLDSEKFFKIIHDHIQEEIQKQALQKQKQNQTPA